MNEKCFPYIESIICLFSVVIFFITSYLALKIWIFICCTYIVNLKELIQQKWQYMLKNVKTICIIDFGGGCHYACTATEEAAYHEHIGYTQKILG
jgi:hypothetical protein